MCEAAYGGKDEPIGWGWYIGRGCCGGSGGSGGKPDPPRPDPPLPLPLDVPVVVCVAVPVVGVVPVVGFDAAGVPLPVVVWGSWNVTRETDFLPVRGAPIEDYLRRAVNSAALDDPAPADARVLGMSESSSESDSSGSNSAGRHFLDKIALRS